MNTTTTPPTTGRYLLLDDGVEERLIALTGEVTRVGRGMASDVLVEDHTVSRRHARLVQRDGATWILDEHATNGTFVNGLLIEAAPLRNGDVIAIGRARITYLAH